jgi:hypothetical protein
MDRGAWILVNCARGQLRDSAFLFGSFVVSQVQAAVFARAGQPEQDRKPFTLFTDEFQNFRGDGFETLLCEARKYRLRLVLAHQHLSQLDPALQRAIFGNVASQVLFSMSPQDAATVGKLLAPGGTEGQALVQLPVGEALFHHRGHPTERVKILPVLTPMVSDRSLSAFGAKIRARHGADPAAVEADIRRRRDGSTPSGGASSASSTPFPASHPSSGTSHPTQPGENPTPPTAKKKRAAAKGSTKGQKITGPAGRKVREADDD